jgi:Uma2 family endonuclease
MTMTVQLKRTPMSRAEFDRLPEGPPYYDYVRGEAIEVNRPTGRHQRVELVLTHLLWDYTRRLGLGEVWHQIDIELPTGDVYGPDIVFLTKEHLDRYHAASGDLLGSPDLVVEILSDSTESYDRSDKLRSYHEARVPWVWLVHQDSLMIEEFQWTPDGFLWLGSSDPNGAFQPRLFPALEIRLAALLEGS